MYWRLPPRSGLFLRCWSLFSSIFGADFITFGIRALDSRVSLLQTGHHGSFAITLSLRRFRSWNFYHAKPKAWGTSCINFRSWFAIFSEIWSVEVRVFAGSRISSKRGDLGKIVVNLLWALDWNSVKSGQKYTNFSRRRKHWHVACVQVRYTEPVHN